MAGAGRVCFFRSLFFFFLVKIKQGRTGDRQADVFETRYGYSWDLCMIFPTEVRGSQTFRQETDRQTDISRGTDIYIFIYEIYFYRERET